MIWHLLVVCNVKSFPIILRILTRLYLLNSYCVMRPKIQFFMFMFVVLHEEPGVQSQFAARSLFAADVLVVFLGLVALNGLVPLILFTVDIFNKEPNLKDFSKGLGRKSCQVAWSDELSSVEARRLGVM